MMPAAGEAEPAVAGPARAAERTLSRSRRAAYLAVPLAGFALLLAATEAAARLALPHVPALDFYVTAPKQRAAFTDRQNVGIFEGDPLLSWRLRPGLEGVVWDNTLVSTNGQGVRHGRALGPKRKGAFRIVCLGDSVTFGYRVPRVYLRRPSELGHLPYTMLIERWLRAANPGRDVEVVALAVPGYSSHQGRAWLERDISWLRPDVVTACFGWNDIDRRTETDRRSMPTGALRVAARRFVARSQALVHASLAVRGLRARAGVAAAPAVMRVPRAEYVENMLAIVGLARARGAGAAVIGAVYGNPVAHPPEGEDIAGHRRALAEALRAEAVPYLEVAELTEARYPANAPLFEEHIHPNHRGHRLLAEALADFLSRERLLGDLARPVPPVH